MFETTTGEFGPRKAMLDKVSCEAILNTDKISSAKSFFNLVKGNVGTGILALPQTLFWAGLWIGLGLLIIFAIICVHCMHLMLQASRIMSKRLNVTSLNLEETAEAAFRHGPDSLRKFTGAVALIMKIFLAVAQIGFCCVYYDFVAINIYQLVECTTGGTGLTWVVYNLILFVPMLVVSSITKLKKISYFSMVSTLCQLTSIAIIFYYCTRDLGQHSVADLPAFGDIKNLPLAFGAFAYTFDAIGLVLPIENKMKYPQHFGGTWGVLNIGMILVVVLYLTFAFFGYLQYGKGIQGSITLNLPANEGLAKSVKGLMSVAIFLSYPLQLYVAVQVLNNAVCRATDTVLMKLIKEYVIRFILVSFTACTSMLLPNIGLFISLVGALSSSTLALLAPPVVHLVAVYPTRGLEYSETIRAAVIVTIGTVGFVMGTYSSIDSIIESNEHSSSNSSLPLCA